ncbi:MATE family efflux transporter [Ectopseudomonas chengduensis]|nr:MATE family efflux transporter [Pseudomonas chengduensis]MDH1281555.1 MATE family efflux transporter [Pseudomonas chengduensis]
MIRLSNVLGVYRLALPLAVSNLIVFASGAIDYFFIGRLGEQELAAASLAFNLYFFIKILGDGIILAIIPMLGKVVDGKDYKAATQVVLNSIIALSLVSLLATPFLISGEWLLNILGQPLELTSLMFPLFLSLTISLLPSFVFVILVTYLSVLHEPWEVFKQSLLYLLAKLIVGYCLFSVLEFGLSSVGISTLLCSMFAIFVVGHHLYRKRQVVFFANKFKLSKHLVSQVLSIGTPIGLLELSTIASTMVAAFFMSPFGESAIAANALAVLSIEIVIVLMFGFSDASAILVSKSVSLSESRRNIISVLVAGLLFSIVLLLVMFIFKGDIPMLFLPDTSESAHTLQLSEDFIEIALFLFIFDSVAIILRGVMQGYGETGMQFFISLMGNWPIGLGLGLALAYAGGFGAKGIWYGMAAGHLFTFVGMVLLVIFREKEQRLESKVRSLIS